MVHTAQVPNCQRFPVPTYINGMFGGTRNIKFWGTWTLCDGSSNESKRKGRPSSYLVNLGLLASEPCVVCQGSPDLRCSWSVPVARAVNVTISELLADPMLRRSLLGGVSTFAGMLPLPDGGPAPRPCIGALFMDLRKAASSSSLASAATHCSRSCCCWWGTSVLSCQSMSKTSSSSLCSRAGPTTRGALLASASPTS